MIYYISDTHLGDQRVFDKCNRPFSDLDELESEIIKRWNVKVDEGDTVYVLGDIAEDDYVKAIEIFKGLKGHKHLIVGNHDLKMLDRIKESNAFESIEFMKLIDDSGKKVCLCHYPVMDWIEFSRGGYHVYGHVHNKTEKNDIAYVQIKQYFKDKPAFNAGVDVTNYEPVTLQEMMSLKEENKDEPYIN